MNESEITLDSIFALEDEEEETPAAKEETKYRTRSTATDIVPVQERTAVPSIIPYLDALSFRPDITSPDFKKDPLSHMICLREVIGIEFNDTKIEGCINTNLYRIKPRDIVDPKEIDLHLLTILYTLIVNQFDNELAQGRVILPNKLTTAKVYIPELLEKMGIDSNVNQEKIDILLKKLKVLDRVYGYVNVTDKNKHHQELARVFILDGYSPKENAFIFSSRYFEIIAYYIQLARIRALEEKTGKRLLDENGNYIRNEKDQVWLIPGHTKLLKTSAYNATKREFAWEIASILCRVIDQAGSAPGTVPHINAKKLIYGCRYFRNALENIKLEKHQNEKLKRTFNSVQDILENHSYLKETYKNIKIKIPLITMRNMGEITIEFPHRGRIKKGHSEEEAKSDEKPTQT